MAPVMLYVYDLSEGTAFGITKLFQIFYRTPVVKGIWHSSLVLYNLEIEYGRDGIQCFDAYKCENNAVKKYYLGETDVGVETLKEYLSFLSHTKFKGNLYNVLNFNCNVFTNFLANELLHKNIPQYLLDLPTDCIQAGIAVFGQTLLHINCKSLKGSVNSENISI